MDANTVGEAASFGRADILYLQEISVVVTSRNIGSALLLKGLAEVAPISHPEQMDAHHLYVALRLASHRIIVCSTPPILPA
jgi:hypothetical protein